MSFLNDDNLKRVWFPFYPRATWARRVDKYGKVAVSKKILIPIGVQELEIDKVIESKTKKGGRKVEIHIYRKPYQVYDYDCGYPVSGEESPKSSFDHIVCTHVKAFRPMGHLNSEWYHHFSMCLGDKDLDTMLTWKGKQFKGVIAHHQEYVQNFGVDKINEWGEKVVYWQPKILSVHRIDDNVVINDYFRLFKPIRYDPIAEGKDLKYHRLFEKNTSNITGGDKEDIIPF